MEFAGRNFRKAQFATTYWGGNPHIKEPPVDLKDATVVCSDIPNPMGCQCTACPECRRLKDHKPVIDIDVPVWVLESSTPGHHHLYIDKSVSWDSYSKLLDALVECGLVESGYVMASKNRGYTSVRLPWVKKAPGEKEAI